MLVGHFAVAFGAKRLAPRPSLGTLVLAAMLADLIWCLLLLAGIETVSFRAGAGAAHYIASAFVPFSHGLLTLAVCAAIFVSIYGTRTVRQRSASVLAACVISHWVLDLISDPFAMPLGPGLPAVSGPGLWNSVSATVAVEGGSWALALVSYAAMTRRGTCARRVGVWIGAATLTLMWYGNITGAPPAGVRQAAIGSLIAFTSAVAWAYWIDAGSENATYDPPDGAPHLPPPAAMTTNSLPPTS
jgi:hypothetical protein